MVTITITKVKLEMFLTPNDQSQQKSH